MGRLEQHQIQAEYNVQPQNYQDHEAATSVGVGVAPAAPSPKNNDTSALLYQNYNQNQSPEVRFPIQTPQQPIPATRRPPPPPTTTTNAPTNGGSAAPVFPPTKHWQTGLLACMNDPTNALVTAFFPCLTFGQIAEIVDEGRSSCETSGCFYGLLALVGLPWIMSHTYRTKLRSKYGIAEADTGPDCFTHFFCECCALCQEYRELQLRGLDPSIGWQGNRGRNQNMKQGEVAMMPPGNQRMMG